MGGRRVRVFHVSDLHMRSADGPQGERAGRDAASRWRVLGQKWNDNLAELRKDGVPFDLVVFTGDLADWGHPTDYPGAVAFLKQTCEVLGVPHERLFVVPGNHDIDRTIQRKAWAWMREHIGGDPRAYSEWMAGGEPRALRRKRHRDQVLERQQAFWGAVTTELGRPELAPWQSPHKRLGYRQTLTLPGLLQPIHVVGLDTSWLAGDEHDTGALWLTEHQVTRLTTTEEGAPLPGFRLALMHHGFADLADAATARRELAGRVDVVLHGHQHELTADVLQGPDSQLVVLAAGCLYEGDERHQYLNACQVIDLELEEDARPRRARVRFRGWSTTSHFWGDHALLYESAPGGLLSLRHGARGWRFDHDAPGPDRRAPQPHKIFVGRDDELARIAAALDGGGGGRVAIVALQGMAGVGKTYLALEFHARYSGRFGGYQHVVLDPEQPGEAKVWMTVLGERMGIEPKFADEATVARALRAQRVLVHIDNVDSAEAARRVAELSRALGGVPLLVTGRYAELGTSPGSEWTRIELTPLDPEAALGLLHAELAGAGITVSESELRELVRQVAGLPLALHLAAGYLRRGVTVDRFLARLRAQGLALEPHDPADHVLADRARGVLSTSFAISRELMLGEAGEHAAGWEAALAALGWAPRAGFGRSLGAAITGLSEASGAFDDFIEAAVALSLVQWLDQEGRAAPTWSVHPLLGEFLRAGTERLEVDARIGGWVTERADDSFSDRARRWDALSLEAAAIGEWLGAATGGVIREILPRTWDFATSRGPLGPWLVAAQRVRRDSADPGVLWALCQFAYQAGDLETVRHAATEMARLAREAQDDRGWALAQGKIADVLADRGELDEALRIRRDEQLPVYERLGDERSCAITQGKIADVLTVRGELKEALRIRREEELPVFERLGEVQLRAVTQGRIADVLKVLGKPEDALRIWREEQLPVYARVGDVRAYTIVLGKIAGVVAEQGEADEALRIRREEELPVYERLGDVRSRAVTMGQIADLLFARGEFEEALRIRREEELPVYERLGDVRSRAIAVGKIADVLFAQGDVDEALWIRKEEELRVYEQLGDRRGSAMTKGKIADVLSMQGDSNEALRIWREEVLPIFEQLGEVRSRTLTLGRMADVLFARGELDEALRIRREEELPVYERLGDVRGRAITQGNIADVLFARGELDEALRIRREEQLPVYARLGDVRSRAITQGKIADVLAARGELDEALRIWREAVLPVFERLGDLRSRAITHGNIADVLAARGELDEALRIWWDSLAVFQQLAAPDLTRFAQQRIEQLEAQRR